MLDTNIISHMMRETTGIAFKNFAATTQGNPNCPVVTSIVVLCELQLGLRRQPNARLEAALERILTGIEVLPVDTAVAPRYAELRTVLELQGTPIDPNDTLIAAHALTLGATLVTGDAEFGRVPGLQLENWLS